ncbi:MAG: DUF1893 domain-containing protein [Ruminococcus sp.]|nr:DUF1893 domain-containing protein [Ruminococcus sp.]MDE6796624.1 DUF1893 domain-containing protein [Ruminococcus sp.]
MKNLEKAKKLLEEGGYTFVAVSRNETITSTERGVIPLLDVIENRKNLKGFSVADKVTGKAGAFLYTVIRPDELFTDVISKPALEVFEENNINVEYNTLTKAIRNRTDTGFCPMETAVKDTSEPLTAISLIREKVKKLNK